MLLAVMLAMAALMMAAAPASAQVFFTSDNDDDFCDDHDCDRDDFCDFFDIDDEDCFDFDRVNDLLDVVGDVSQDIEQDADSGDIDQDFSVTSTGDNSNQCVGIQGTANTGNAQNALGVTDFGNDNGDRFFGHRFDRRDHHRFFGNNGGFDIDDSGADIDVGGTNTTDCTSEINQAASASG